MRPRTLDAHLEDARRRIDRLEPIEALEAARRGALLVDIRSDAAREATGVVPGSVHIPRTVLEWRLDPDGPWRNPHVGERARDVVVICDQGFSSSLAAAALVELGLVARAADVVGGFEAWREAGLPVAPARRRDPGELPGMAPPEPA